MANPLTRFLTDRLITPAVQAQLPPVTKDTTAFAVGVWPTPDLNLKDTFGQFPDADYGLLYAVYKAHADVSACVGIWAGSVTGNGWRIGLLDLDAKPTSAQQAQIDELTAWLKNPNPTKRFSRILYELVAHMAITGDSYLNKVTDAKGRIKELWSVHPATVRIVADEHGDIHGYIQFYRGQNVAQFAPAEIARFQLPSVVNDLYGHSPLESVLEEVHVDLQALRSNRAIIENGFKPSVVLLLKDGAKDTAERLKALISQKHTGAAHQHGVMAVSGVDDIKPYAQSLKDMEFTALRALTTEKVSTAFRVPKFMLNQKESADLATSAVQERQFFNSTVKPVQDLVAEIFTEEIIHTFNPDLGFFFNEPDFNDADALRRDALLANKQDPRIVDVNELRTRYFFLPPRENLPDPMEEATDHADDAATTTDPQPNQTTTVREDEADPDAGTAAEAAPKPAANAAKPAKKTIIKAITPQERDALRDKRGRLLDDLEAHLYPQVVRYFTRQESRYLEALPAAFATTKSAVRKGVVDDLVGGFVADHPDDDRELSLLLYAELDPAAAAGVQEAGLQVGFSFDATAQTKIVTDYLLANALQHATGINQTTRDQLAASLSQGVKDGEGIPELTARVKSIFTTASTARATAIARTETAQAFEYANQRAMKESGVVEAKQFLTAEDERVCPVCLPLDGVVVPLDQHFPGGLEPGSCHVSCRCTSVGIVA